MSSMKQPMLGWLLVVALGLVAPSAWAVGTESGLTITNAVTVDYQVNSVAQSQLTASTSFVVDNKVDLTVSSGANLVVTPGQTDRVQTFTVTNTGNTTQGYLLAVEPDPASTFTAGNVRIYIESGATPGFQAAEDTLYVANTNAGDLNPNGVLGVDDTMTVHVVVDVPAAATDGQESRVNLLATTTEAGSATVLLSNAADAWDPATVQVVFAEGAAGAHSADAPNDGKNSAQAVYEVASAALTVTKTPAVTDDGFSAADFKAIPGATVQYTITLSNTGSVDATDVEVVDTFPANVSYVTNSTTVDGEAINDGATGAVTGAVVTATATDLTVEGFTVPASDTVDVVFEVTID